MPRKVKPKSVDKEYGVNDSNYKKPDQDFTQNQIVQISIDPGALHVKKTMMEYDPNIEKEPVGLQDSSLDEFQEIASTEQNVKDVKRENEMSEKMKTRNQEIENELMQRSKKYDIEEHKTMLHWVDLEQSGAYVQNLHKWPNVKLNCFWCLESFDNMPWPLVVGRTKDGKFKVRGHHCSPNCALAYGLDSREMSESIPVSTIYSSMQAFVYKVTGDYSNLRPSPPRFAMKKMGGPLDPVAFRLECNMKNYNSYLTYPPLETSLPVWNRIKEGQENVDNNDELVLKRSKPFYDTSQSLDSLWKSQYVKK